MGAHYQYTEEQLTFLKDNYKHMSRVELKDAFNKRFGTTLARTTIINTCNRHGWRARTDGRFTAETSPRWQKGLDKVEFKSHYTRQSFDEMTSHLNKPERVYHIGDTIIRNGIPCIIVDETSGKDMDERSVNKARYVYEQAYGKLTDQDLIIHLDGDVMNCDIDNLVCVKQRWRAEFIHNGWWHASADVIQAAIAYCKLKDAIKGALA